jgi:hypothetical protein
MLGIIGVIRIFFLISSAVIVFNSMFLVASLIIEGVIIALVLNLESSGLLPYFISSLLIEIIAVTCIDELDIKYDPIPVTTTHIITISIISHLFFIKFSIISRSEISSNFVSSIYFFLLTFLFLDFINSLSIIIRVESISPKKSAKAYTTFSLIFSIIFVLLIFSIAFPILFV